MTDTTSFEYAWQRADAEGRNEVYNAYIEPMVVQQHSNMLDDNSPVVKEWFVADGPCGFAWVNIKPGTCRLARWLKKQGIARSDSYYGGVTIWVGDYGQSMQKKAAYARGVARILNDVEGVKYARAMSRMD